MSEPKSFFTTLPGILTGLAALVTAVGGLLYALSEIGFIGPSGKDDIQPPIVVSNQPAAKTSTQSSTVSSTTPTEPTTDGWAIIGKYQRGEFSDLKLMVHGDSPAIGRRYDVVDDFRLVQKHPDQKNRGEATITLGKVHRGDSVEIIDIKIPPGFKMVSAWAKLRAVLHKRK